MSIINKWNTRTVGDDDQLTYAQFTALSNPVHIQSSNLDNLRLIKLIGEITGLARVKELEVAPDGQPIAGTGKVENFNQSVTNGTTYDVFTPGSGEVWNFMAAGYTATVSSGTLDAIQIKIGDGVNELMVAENLNDSYDGLIRFSDPLFVDENLTIKVRTSDASVSALDLNLLLIRIR